MASAYGRGVAISSISLAELRVGARNIEADPEDMKRLNLLVRLLTVRPFDEAAAEAYGQVARLIGVKRRSFDRLIAAHALALTCTLVTSNLSDFSPIPGLKVENWRDN
jgi:tRNA(fMet)-specific endonuclease VapC